MRPRALLSPHLRLDLLRSDLYRPARPLLATNTAKRPHPPRRSLLHRETPAPGRHEWTPLPVASRSASRGPPTGSPAAPAGSPSTAATHGDEYREGRTAAPR